MTVRLGVADLRAVVDFLGDVARAEPDDAYPPELLLRLEDLIRFDEAGYQEFDTGARRTCFMAGIDRSGPYGFGSQEPGCPLEPDPEDELYWSSGPCPIVHHRISACDTTAIRLSDLISQTAFHELPVYRDCFRHYDIEYMLDIGLPPQLGRHRSLILFRTAGGRDFSDRDRAVLDLLRPHLERREQLGALRRRMGLDLSRAGAVNGADALTPREREIVALVARGKTNAEIAAELWVAPSTVKKHLENVYGKLGVGRRAAAATLVNAHG